MTIRETEIVAVGDVDVGSAVSWAAVIAGALVAVAASLILMLVGSGIGLTVVSPWSNANPSVTAFAISSVIWLVVVQWLSSALGGYLAGRLRIRWAGVHSDEVNFRDSAHGLLTWALATIIVASILSSAVSSIVGGTVNTVATVTSGAAQGAAQTAGNTLTDPTGYFVDTLFRVPPSGSANSQSAEPTSGTANAKEPDVRGEATRILVQGAASDEITAGDKTYLTELVGRDTGLAHPDAEKRVNDVLAQVQAAKTKAKEAAEAARKVSATFAILMALALAVGAFVASVAAIIGGNQRDEPARLLNTARRPVSQSMR